MLFAIAVSIIAVGVVWRQQFYRDSSKQDTLRLVKTHDFDKALGVVTERWLAAEPASGEAHYWQGRILVGLDRPQEALSALEKARSLGYPEPELERVVGVILFKSGRLTQAEPMLTRDLERNPQPDADRDEALARLYVQMYRFGPAWQAIERWTAAAPEDPKPHLLRAEVAAQTLGGTEQMANAFREALRRDPRLKVARMGLADALRTQGQYAQALVEYQSLLSESPDDSDTLTGAGLAALAAGQESQAQVYLDQALKLDAKNVEAIDGRALISVRRREFLQALPLLDQALAIDPNQPEIHYRRAIVLDALERRDEARVERETTDRLRREAAELDALRKKLLRSPRDTEAQGHLAEWLLHHGLDEEGLVWAQRALSAPSGHPPTARVLAGYYEKLGNSARANYYRTLAGTEQ